MKASFRSQNEPNFTARLQGDSLFKDDYFTQFSGVGAEFIGEKASAFVGRQSRSAESRPATFLRNEANFSARPSHGRERTEALLTQA